MKLTETLDISARLMVRAKHLLQSDALVADRALHSYWIYSRDLANNWMLNLSVCQKVLAIGDPIRSQQCWVEYEPDLREILRADILHRVWFTILQAADIQKSVNHCEPIASSVLNHQLQVRSRALKLILNGYKIDSVRMQRLNEIRKSAEAWSDLICAHLVGKYQIKGILFDEKRGNRWGNQPLEILLPEMKLPITNSKQAELNWNIIASTQTPRTLGSLQRLVRTMLDCFPPSTFEYDGTLRPISK